MYMHINHVYHTIYVCIMYCNLYPHKQWFLCNEELDSSQTPERLIGHNEQEDSNSALMNSSVSCMEESELLSVCKVLGLYTWAEEALL